MHPRHKNDDSSDPLRWPEKILKTRGKWVLETIIRCGLRSHKYLDKYKHVIMWTVQNLYRIKNKLRFQPNKYQLFFSH